MANVEHLQPEGMSPNGGRYTHVVKVGPWVFIAGQTASDENGDVVGIGDPAAQVGQVMKNLRTACESVGGKFEDIVKTTVFIKDIDPEKVQTVGRAQAKVLQLDPPRAATWVGVTGLVFPSLLVEVEATAVVAAE